MARIAATLPLSLLLMGASIPAEQASPPALGGLPYTPHCTQLTPYKYEAGFNHWGPVIDGLHYPWYPIPEAWDVHRTYVELDAAGLCVVDGVPVPFEVESVENKSLATGMPVIAPLDVIGGGDSNLKTPEEMLLASITPNPNKANSDNGFHPALLLFVVAGAVGWKLIGREPSDEETVRDFFADKSNQLAETHSHLLVAEHALSPAAPPVSEPLPDARNPQETAGDGSGDCFGRLPETVSGDDDRKLLERSWVEGSADITQEVRDRVLDEIEANYSQKPQLIIQSMTLSDFKKGHCQAGGRFDVDKIDEDNSGELEQYASGRAYQFLERYHPPYIKHMVWWVFGLQQKGDDGSPYAQKYQRSKAFCERCIEDWKNPPF